jgi:hypothetical protein
MSKKDFRRFPHPRMEFFYGVLLMMLLSRYPHFPPKKEKSVTHVSGTICYLCFGSLTAVWNRCPICPIPVLSVLQSVPVLF